MADSPPSQPRAGVDCPRTFLEFAEFFPDEKACAAYLEPTFRNFWKGQFGISDRDGPLSGVGRWVHAEEAEELFLEGG
jgi:hypothetical protein